MRYSTINFILLIVILIFIVIFCFFIIDYYYTISDFCNQVIDKTNSLIPSFSNIENHIIDYSDDIDCNIFDTGEFNKDISILLANINMSSYNLSIDDDPIYPEYITYLNQIGNNGYLSKITDDENNRNIYILSYRGTTSSHDLLTDLDSVQISYKGISSKQIKINKNIKVHRGFYNYWINNKSDLRQISKLLKLDDILIITGHSLGCSTASMTALGLSQYNSKLNIQLYMFAPPRVGNDKFIYELDDNVPNNYAIINSSDLIPELPPVILPTIGNNWIYDNWSHQIKLDIQLGSIIQNHSLNTYMCGIDNTLESCNEIEPIWIRKYTYINKQKSI